MAALLTLARRELAGHFFSLRGYVIMAGVQLLLGASLLTVVYLLNGLAYDLPFTEKFPQTEFFWLVLLMVAPVITMRTFAHEKASGTFETLMTTPVSDIQVVMAKFIGSYVFFLIAFLPTVIYPFLLERYAHEALKVDPGAVWSLAVGIGLYGAFFMALGCFASSLTRSQIVAAVLTFAVGTGLFILGYLADLRPTEVQWWHHLVQHISMLRHMQDFSTGIVDSRHVMFYLSLTAVFLFFTLKSVESRRWK
jgi:ABC-2 type transport system permease protein